MSESQSSDEYVEAEDQSSNEYDNVELNSDNKETKTPHIDEELKHHNIENLGKLFSAIFL